MIPDDHKIILLVGLTAIGFNSDHFLVGVIAIGFQKTILLIVLRIILFKNDHISLTGLMAMWLQHDQESSSGLILMAIGFQNGHVPRCFNGHNFQR